MLQGPGGSGLQELGVMRVMKMLHCEQDGLEGTKTVSACLFPRTKRGLGMSPSSQPQAGRTSGADPT